MSHINNHLYPRRYLPCGGVAYFDHESGISYRCNTCFATLGSIAQPRACKEEAKWEAWKALGGQEWNYGLGKPTEVKNV